MISLISTVAASMPVVRPAPTTTRTPPGASRFSGRGGRLIARTFDRDVDGDVGGVGLVGRDRRGVGIRRELRPIGSRLNQQHTVGRFEGRHSARELADGAAARHQHRASPQLAGELHGTQSCCGGFYPGGFRWVEFRRDGPQVGWKCGHQRCERAVGLQAQRRFECRLAAEVGPTRFAKFAHTTDVSVGVDGDPLTNAPLGHIGPYGYDLPGGFVSEDAVTVVDLRQLTRMKIASADAAQLHFDDYLVGSQCRLRAVFECDRAFSGEYHCRHCHSHDLCCSVMRRDTDPTCPRQRRSPAPSARH